MDNGELFDMKNDPWKEKTNAEPADAKPRLSAEMAKLK